MLELGRRALLVATCMVIAVATAHADIPPPGVLAVCQTTLTNGDRVDGIVLLSRLGRQGNPTDGFTVEYARGDGTPSRRVHMFEVSTSAEEWFIRAFREADNLVV